MELIDAWVEAVNASTPAFSGSLVLTKPHIVRVKSASFSKSSSADVMMKMSDRSSHWSQGRSKILQRTKKIHLKRLLPKIPLHLKKLHLKRILLKKLHPKRILIKKLHLNRILPRMLLKKLHPKRKKILRKKKRIPEWKKKKE